MTVAENRERSHYVGTTACDRWPLRDHYCCASAGQSAKYSVLEPTVSILGLR